MMMKPVATLIIAASMGSAALAQVTLTAEAPSPGGPAHLSVSQLTEIAGTQGIANIQLTDGQTLTNAIQNVAEGKTDIAASPYILPFLMSRGVGPYGSLGKEKGAALADNLRAINPFTLGIFFLFAYDAKGIGGWDDLEGRKIYNGPPRGGALTDARNIIEIITGLKDGEGYEGLQVNWGQSVATIMSGEADANVLPEVFPGNRLTTAISAGKMTGWPVPVQIYEGQAMQRFMQAPGLAPFTINLAELEEKMGADWTFISEDDTFRGVATIGGNLVHKDMDEDLVYDLVSAYIASISDLMAKAPYGDTVGFNTPMQGMCGSNILKFHPGAVRAWRDAGYEIDACAAAG